MIWTLFLISRLIFQRTTGIMLLFILSRRRVFRSGIIISVSFVTRLVAAVVKLLKFGRGRLL